MSKVVISDNHKGILFKNGKYTGILDAGKYRELFGRKIVISDKDSMIQPCFCDIDTVLKDKRAAENITAVDVSDTEYALHFVNGKFKEILRCGKYAFWNENNIHEFVKTDITDPTVSDDIPKYIFTLKTSEYFTKIEVAEYQKARVYFNKKLVKILDAGTYFFWKTNVNVAADIVDMRLTQLNIIGQEILTKDKVSLRVNLVCAYRITDCVKILTEIDDFKEQLHIASQLALRDYVGKHTIDELLDSKEELSEYILQILRAKQDSLYIEIDSAGVKDIILPGEIRDIMNTVIAAEKRAQANVITRREEVASTRSLLNTARLMDENKTLYKLKELEYVERICENVGNINIESNSGILSQLTALLRNPNS